MKTTLSIMCALACALAACGADTDADTEPCVPFPDSCTGDNICFENSCVPAFGRFYALANVTLRVPLLNAQFGEPWDAVGDPPDLYLGDIAGTAATATVHNSYSASFTGPFEIGIPKDAGMRIDAWDDDYDQNTAIKFQYAFGCQSDQLTAALLRTRQFGCASPDASYQLTSTIHPRGEQ